MKKIFHLCFIFSLFIGPSLYAGNNDTNHETAATFAAMNTEVTSVGQWIALIVATVSVVVAIVMAAARLNLALILPSIAICFLSVYGFTIIDQLFAALI